MKDSIEDLFQDLLDLEESKPLFGSTSYSPNQDDVEEFFTSEELVKQEKLKEQQEKIVRPGQGPRGGQIKPPEEELHFHRYAVKREHKYTETEMRQIRESCMTTIVHDYGEKDPYHMSDEERAEHDMLAEIRDKLQPLKRTYWKADQYVEAMRVVVQAWNILERNNYVHSRDEFFEMVSDGRIYSTSIIMPKLKKMDNYNFDLIVKLISNPEADASILARKDDMASDDDWYDFTNQMYDEYHDHFLDQFDILKDQYMSDDLSTALKEVETLEAERISLEAKIESLKEYPEKKEELDQAEEEMGKLKEKIGKAQKKLDELKEEKADEYARDMIDEDEMYRLLSPEEAEYLQKYVDNPPPLEVRSMKRKYIKNYDQRMFGRRKKKWSKKDQHIRDHLHALLNKIQNTYGRATTTYGYDPSSLITGGMFEPEKPFEDFWDKIRFDGSWANKNDVFVYDMVIRNEMSKQHPRGQRYLTYADQELDKFFQTLEEAGINTLELRRMMNLNADGLSVSSVKTAAAKKKENKKIEAAIIDRVTKLNRSPKFKKLVAKQEKKVNDYLEDN